MKDSYVISSKQYDRGNLSGGGWGGGPPPPLAGRACRRGEKIILLSGDDIDPKNLLDYGEFLVNQSIKQKCF